MAFVRAHALVCALALGASIAWAKSEYDPAAQSVEPAKSESNPDTATGNELLKTQEEQLASQYKRFEEVLLRMAELTAGEDPQRATLLRQAVARSKKRLISAQFDRLIDLLGEDRLSVALTNQNELMDDLKHLLDLLLSEDRAKRLESERERIRAYLKDLNKLIGEQQGIQAQTRGAGDKQAKLADRQARLADRTNKLREQIKKDTDESRRAAGSDEDATPESDGPESSDAESKSSDGSQESKANDEKQKSSPDSPQSGEQKSGAEKSDSQKSGDQKSGDGRSRSKQPGEEESSEKQAQEQPGEQSAPDRQSEGTDSAGRRLKAAKERMSEAQRKLKEAQREAALDRQRSALDELEQAKADLEKILRQLREEEMARMLAFLEGRFRKMLEDQTQVLEGTERLTKLPADERNRSVEIESGRLSRKESQIALEADKALALLHEDATAVAIPEAVRQLRDDMQLVTQRLAEFKADDITLGIEQDIIAGLEDILAALERAQNDLQQKQNDQQQSPPSGQPQEPPLVDSLAELKVIRALQMRVNRRTETFSRLVDGEQAIQPEIVAALADLAQRQARIYQTTRDIAAGRNQ